MILAKFVCERVEDGNGVDGEKEVEHVTLRAVYSEDPTSENYSWSKATPGGQVMMSITNPAAFEQFLPGEEYLVTFANARTE